MGTSSKQGKFTLQLEMRERFINSGYKVGQLGTEPTSYLYGMEECYPYGFNSFALLSKGDEISYINNLMHRIENKEVDIIMFGLQSNLVHGSSGNIAFYPMSQYEMLTGTDPDVLFLCVNFDDNEEYIMRSIYYLKAVTFAKKIFIVLFPFSKQFTWSDNFVDDFEKMDINLINSKKDQLISLTGYDIYDLTAKNDLDRLYEATISYFTEG